MSVPPTAEDCLLYWRLLCDTTLCKVVVKLPWGTPVELKSALPTQYTIRNGALPLWQPAYCVLPGSMITTIEGKGRPQLCKKDDSLSDAKDCLRSYALGNTANLCHRNSGVSTASRRAQV